jgi:enoyl-CoA hydratase
MINIARKDAVALIRYDRGAKANALCLEAISALSDAARELASDDEVSVVVLTGTEKRFSAGVDLDDDAIWRPGAPDVERRRTMSAGGEMCALWSALPQVTICAIEGPAIGGGGILSLATDFRILAEDAYFHFPEIRLGLSFGWGGLASLSSLVGVTSAKRLLFTAPKIDAAQAQQIGLCEEVVPKAKAVERAMELAETIALCPPLVLRITKRSMDAALRSNWAAGYEVDQSLLTDLLMSAKR